MSFPLEIGLYPTPMDYPLNGAWSPTLHSHVQWRTAQAIWRCTYLHQLLAYHSKARTPHFAPYTADLIFGMVVEQRENVILAQGMV